MSTSSVNNPAPPQTSNEPSEEPQPETSQTNGSQDGGDDAPTTVSEPPPVETTTEQPPPDPSTAVSEPPPPETTTAVDEPSTTTTVAEPTTTTTEQQPTTTTEEEAPPITTTTTEEDIPTTSEQPEPTVTEGTTTEVVVTTNEVGSTATSIVTRTRTREAPVDDTTTTTVPTTNPTPINPGSGSGSGGLDSGARIAIGVVVPIASIAILALVALFFWKKRKARRAAAEERRKEVEDYSYNPNADPTIPNVGGLGGMGGAADGGHEMREDSSGYRGWGTTVAGSSTGRKASTTMSGGGLAYSDPASPTQQHASLARGDEVYSPEGEILGAMGPAAANNRGNGVNRGPSNASSSYSAANRSDNSDGNLSYGHGPGHYDQGAHNPYELPGGGAPNELSAAPVIKDNPARRNTRIENPSHFPQQSAGISQNF
ncbi:putative serine-rich protein-like protein [Emericellopsis cladophorae]|uniref:Serine-rich protein-like protein n=1 Tax=Emericellopsis cladophorae TaxID=2686198 RepID=A0A9P9Y037_9HYPO|nr:putative serine-rich protein-like protein [Emericellopsis cladophorae]KAI6780880.1 putative serine-rich protein-like protein [Emericellopsis cladophorae]